MQQTSMASDLSSLLRDLSICPDSVKVRLGNILENLENEEIRKQYIDEGITEVVRDISSSDTCDLDVCYNALKVLNCLAHSNIPVKQRLLKPPGFLQKLVKFCSATDHHKIGIINDQKAILISVQEEAIDLIRKLVLCSECLVEVATLDIIQHMLDLAGIFLDNTKRQNSCGYSPQATSYLHDLSHGRKLVGKIRQFSTDVGKQIFDECKPEMEGRDMLPTNRPGFSVFSVELYDTTTDQDIKINNELIKEGLAWPQFLTTEEQSKVFIQHKAKEEHVWADIMVTSVVDGGHFWAQIGGEVVNEKLREIKNILLSEEQNELKTAPKVGELFCVRSTVAGHHDAYRGKVLQVLATDNETVIEAFALDYGYKNVISMESLRELPSKLLAVSYQAQFCCLSGVQPPPARSLVVENAAGALRSLGYSSNACRIQILERDGVDVLVKLCSVPDKSICTQAVGALLNLSINFKSRARIGFLGGIKNILDIIQRYLDTDVHLVFLAVGTLRNLMLDVPVNRARVAELDGTIILTHVYFTCSDTDLKKECLGALKNLIGNAWYMLTGSGGIDFRSVVDRTTTKPFSLAVSPDQCFMPTKIKSRKGKDCRPGEVEPKPIEKALASHVIRSGNNSSCDESDKESGGRLSHDDRTDGETTEDGGDERLLTPSPRLTHEQVDAGNVKSKGECQSYYVQGQMVPFCEDESHELRETASPKSLSSAVVSRPACAFLNAGKGGTVYLGVKKSRIVSGVEISRKDRDRLRLGVDELLGDFRPPVRYDKYQVNFVPVAEENSSHRKSIQFIPDRFVIEVVFQKCSDVVYSTNKRRSYFRCGTANSELSTQEIRKWVVREQEAIYNKQILSLKKAITDTKQKLGLEL